MSEALGNWLVVVYDFIFSYPTIWLDEWGHGSLSKGENIDLFACSQSKQNCYKPGAALQRRGKKSLFCIYLHRFHSSDNKRTITFSFEIKGFLLMKNKISKTMRTNLDYIYLLPHYNFTAQTRDPVKSVSAATQKPVCSQQLIEEIFQNIECALITLYKC